MIANVVVLVKISMSAATQHAGVFRDDGGGRVLGDGVEVGF